MSLQPLLIAHRGASFEAPENTLAAFRLAWQQGADGIEGDFHLTRDGVIVCHHDANTRRTGGHDLAVAQATMAELRQLDVGAWKDPQWRGESIPTLDEVLATVPAGKRIFIEIKCGPELLAPLAAVVARSGLAPAQMVIISFSAEVIAASRRQLPQLKAMLLRGFDPDAATGVWHPTADELVTSLTATDASGADLAAGPQVNAELVAALRTAHRELHLWVIDDLATAQRFCELRADSLTTNRPGWLRAQLGWPAHT